MWFVSTASHGGIKVTRALNAQIPEYMRCEGGWYEEDCDWSIPALVFADTITSDSLKKSIADGSARSTLLSYRPEAFEKFTGEVVYPGMSYARDQEIFERDNKDNWVVIAAYGSWHAQVPKGFVGVTCTRGGLRGSGYPVAHFLVAETEYEARGGNFVANPEKHQAIPRFS
jgi:hypothetical protein